MKCNEVENRIMKFISGSLDEAEHAKVSRHLDACPVCRETYADEVELVSVFKTEIEPVAGAYFVTDVMGGIESELNRQYAEMRVNPGQKIVIAAGVVWAVIILIVLWQMDNLFTGDVSSLSTFFSWVYSQGASIWTQLSGFALWVFGEGKTIVDTSSSSLNNFSSQYSTLITAATVASALTGIILVGGYRSRLVEELKHE